MLTVLSYTRLVYNVDSYDSKIYQSLFLFIRWLVFDHDHSNCDHLSRIYILSIYLEESISCCFIYILGHTIRQVQIDLLQNTNSWYLTMYKIQYFGYLYMIRLSSFTRCYVWNLLHKYLKTSSLRVFLTTVVWIIGKINSINMY